MTKIFNLIWILFAVFRSSSCFRNQHYSRDDIFQKREEVRQIFQHAYEGYLNYASGYDELRPLTCDGINTWGSYSLTLIDALDTLAVMGNYTEFQRVVNYLVENSNFDSDINVSVFETNIRIVGGLLSAHLMSRRAGIQLEPGWPCNGPLLRMAEDVAKRLLPAFDTKTGMPYGTVNLRYGVPAGETPITCTAGVGTFLVEFGALSRLTGDPIYEEVALNAVYSLWKYRSPIGLFGNHIDVQTGKWTAQDSGIGAGVDSYFEYLVKGAVMLNRPDLLEMFYESRKAIDKYMRKEDWYVWVSMTKAQVTLPVFQSLEAFWPGVLSTIGDIELASKTFAKYHSVWKQYGFLPEFYNIPNLEATANRESYPLRPEIIESAMYLYRATKDQYYLEFGDDMLTSIQHSSRTECGYATIKNVRTHERENRMESFFLAETTKYLYLLFDPDNFIHNDGSRGLLFDTPNGQCVIEAGNYIFNTEAHPIDPSALNCCHDMPRTDIFSDFDIDSYKGNALVLAERKRLLEKREEENNNLGCHDIQPRNANITIDLEFVTEIDTNLNTSQQFISEVEKGNLNNYLKKEPIEPIITVDKDWIELSKSFQMKLDEIVKNQSTISDEEISNLLKFIMEKININNKILTNSNPLFNWTYVSENNNSNVVINLYEIYIIRQISKLNENFIKNIDEYSKNLDKNISIDVQQLLFIVGDILSSIKQNKFQKYNESNPHHSFLVKSLQRAQQIYENSIKNPIEIYNFIVQINNGSYLLEEDHNHEILQILNFFTIIHKISNNTNLLNQTNDNIILNYEIFESLSNLIVLKRKLADSVEQLLRLTSVLKQLQGNVSDSLNSKSTESFKEISNEITDFTEEKDDIIVPFKESLEDNEIESGVGSVEPVNDEDFRTLEQSNDDDLIKKQSNILAKTKETEETYKKIDDSDLRLQTPNLKSYLDESLENSSILTDFVQSILKSTIPTKPKFDPQILLEKIRSQGDYMNYRPNWELFSCKALSYLQKLYVHEIV